MIVLVDKVGRVSWVSATVVAVARHLGLSEATVRRRLPYWEDSRWLLCDGGMLKSKNRGNANNFR